MDAECVGSHRFFVAESGIVEGEGLVCVLIVCTACGESKLISHKAANIQLSKKETK